MLMKFSTFKPIREKDEMIEEADGDVAVKIANANQTEVGLEDKFLFR